MMIACFHAESNVVIMTMLKLTCCTCLWECRKMRVSGRTPKSKVKVCIQGQQRCQATLMPQETCNLSSRTALESSPLPGQPSPHPEHLRRMPQGLP